MAYTTEKSIVKPELSFRRLLKTTTVTIQIKNFTRKTDVELWSKPIDVDLEKYKR